MRMGPLTYLLPLYSPLCLIEEVAILDHLCDGRLDVGVGRGVSAFELNYHNVDVDTSREVFRETLDILINGLTHDWLNHEGTHYTYTKVPMELHSQQQPHPADLVSVVQYHRLHIFRRDGLPLHDARRRTIGGGMHRRL